MSLSNPYAQYRQNTIETSSPTRMVVMLYDGAIRFLTQALTAMEARRHEVQSVLIGKASAIIAHLHDSLDAEVGRAFAGSLSGIYTALLRTLMQANVENKPGPIEEAIEILRDLRETWAEVDRQCRPAPTRELVAA